MQYPKRLIEVDLPIKRISEHARREKSIRHGHLSTLHVWWARRPLGACRAVVCAALWPDPADDHCPPTFRDAVATALSSFAEKVRSDAALAELCRTSWSRWNRLSPTSLRPDDPHCWSDMRYALLDFIADFANWDASTVPAFLETSEVLTEAAHAGLGGSIGTRPLVVDPFAGGGAIPLEAMRVGAETFASDINPVAVLLNRVTLDFAPNFGPALSEQVLKWGKWVKEQARRELAKLYPNDPDGFTPITYLWARTVKCEGPNCGSEIPLLSTLWLSRKSGQSYALAMTANGPGSRIQFGLQVNPNPNDVGKGATSGNAATCPACGFTTPVAHVRQQLSERGGGSSDARLVAVVFTKPGAQGKYFRLPTDEDLLAVEHAHARLSDLESDTIAGVSAIPDEPCPPEGALGFRFQKYGILRWRDLYTPRQLVALSTFAKILMSHELHVQLTAELSSSHADIVKTCLALALGRVNDLSATLCRWLPTLNAVAATNGGQNKMPMILDFAEANPVGGSGGDWMGQIDWITRVLRHLEASKLKGRLVGVERSEAQISVLPDDSADALVTDPPYYDAFGYADLSEFYLIWLRRSVPETVLSYRDPQPPKANEAISIGRDVADGRGTKNNASYRKAMRTAFQTARQITKPGSIGVVVFANKTTSGWEAILEGLVEAGWIATASWPIDTERPNRQRAIDSAALNSSVHIVCRPRENPDGSLRSKDTGDWRDVLQELPQRIHDWMPRLAAEGVVGADAIFACLGPALEIFSRHSIVEKPNGDQVKLKEYLEHVWAAVAREALTMVFQGADATGFEPDARLAAMWLWTLSAGTTSNGASTVVDDADISSDNEDGKPTTSSGGYALEYDAARKIAQGLGADLSRLDTLVQMKGDTARLLPVGERAPYLFAEKAGQTPPARRKKEVTQISMFDLARDDGSSADGWRELTVPAAGATVLDRLHQSMILFGASRGEALRRFLVDDGVGQDQRFWRLAQALSALYPSTSDEKRWVDGVLGRKKSFGF